MCQQDFDPNVYISIYINKEDVCDEYSLHVARMTHIQPTC